MNITSIWELKKIALRNLSRHKVKTVLTSAAVMISVAMYIFMSSWIGGMTIESRRNIVNFDMGAAKLQTRLYFEKFKDRPSYENFKNWERYRDALDREGYYSTPRYVFGGMAFASSGASAPIAVNAIDVETEPRVLHYSKYVDFGRFPESGRFEIALGTIAAEKLRVGIPTRPFKKDLDTLIAQAARNEADAEFIRSLYNEAQAPGGFLVIEEKVRPGNERMALKRDASREDLNKYWALIAATDRNNVRVNAMIDIKAVPEVIRTHRWEGELVPELREEDRALVEAAYKFNDIVGGYELTEEDPAKLDMVLTAMIRADYAGAVRQINQLINAVVVGVINSPDPVPNASAYIPIDALQDEAGMMLEGAVTELIIRKKGVSDASLPGKDESAEAILAALERGLGEPLPGELGVFNWLGYIKDYLGFEQYENTMPKFLMGLLFCLALLGISNTVLLAILERTKEIGMMRALGMTDKQMVWVYMFEAGFIGLIGSLAGTALGCLMNWPMVEYGWDMSQMANELDGGVGFRVTTVMRSAWDFVTLGYTWAVATALAACAAYFPTKRAVRMPITDSLRFD